MNKIKIKIVMFIFVIAFISIFISNKMIYAATSFPNSIKSSINYDYVGSNSYCNLGKEQGRPVCAKMFSAGSVSQTAMCTAFKRNAPEGITCTPVAWSNNSYNDKVSGAVGAIIYAARDNKSSGAMSWDNYYYAELAINYLLHYGHAAGRGYGSDDNKFEIPQNSKFNRAKFDQYVKIGNYNFFNYGNIKVNVTNPTFDSSTGKATAVVKCTDFQGKGTGCNLTKKQVSYMTQGSTNWTTVDATISSSTTISANIPTDTVKLKFIVEDKQCWNTAKNYSCGASYQSLVPNYLVDSCKTTKAESPEIENTVYKLEVHKRDADNQPLPGATVKVTRNDQNIVSTNDGYIDLVDGRFDLPNAPAGRYCVGEVKSPAGYKLSEETQCVEIGESNPNGTIIIKNVKENKNLTINKVDESGNPVSGAIITVTDLDCTLSLNDGDDLSVCAVASFETDGNPKVIENLEVNKTYIVNEDVFPRGYVGENNMKEITISEDASKNVVTLTNTQPVIKISKQSVTSTKELPGAELIITDAQGQEMARWTSGDVPREISGLSDGDYTLTETTAPQGYTVAESIKFTIEDGVVKGDEDNMVVMKDATIVDVPDTFNIQNIIAMISGLVLVGLGTGVLFYETKKKKA